MSKIIKTEHALMNIYEYDKTDSHQSISKIKLSSLSVLDDSYPVFNLNDYELLNKFDNNLIKYLEEVSVEFILASIKLAHQNICSNELKLQIKFIKDNSFKFYETIIYFRDKDYFDLNMNDYNLVHKMFRDITGYLEDNSYSIKSDRGSNDIKINLHFSNDMPIFTEVSCVRLNKDITEVPNIIFNENVIPMDMMKSLDNLDAKIDYIKLIIIRFILWLLDKYKKTDTKTDYLILYFSINNQVYEFKFKPVKLDYYNLTKTDNFIIEELTMFLNGNI